MLQNNNAVIVESDEWTALALQARDDQVALETLLKKVRPHIASYIRSRGRISGEDVEDVVQQVCIRIAKHIGNYDSNRGAFMAWMKVIAARILMNHNRDRRRRARKLEEYKIRLDANHHHEASRHFWRPDRALEVQQFEERLNRAIARLEPHHKKTIHMILKGYNYEQIAKIEGVKMGTVKSRIFRARERLLNNLGEYAHAHR